MRILLVHNLYGSEAPSGENVVYEAEKSLLEQHGHDIKVFNRESDEIRRQGLWGAVKGAAAVPWNPFAAAALSKIVGEFQPDIVHVHNTFPLISPAIFYAIGKRAARVLTLHNYRTLCPAAIPMRNGKVCTDCVQRRSVLPAMQHGCYRNSRVATMPIAASVSLHRALGTWRHQVDAFIALSGFQREVLIQGGMPAHKLHIKPNFFAGNPNVIPNNQRGNYVVFVGRLGQEKGVSTLIEAWRHWGNTAPELKIVGDGPLNEQLQLQAEGLSVNFLGQVSPEQAQKEIANASLLVLPSECFEGFPMVIREAFAYGTPVAASKIGPLTSIIENNTNGILFDVANSASLLAAVRSVMDTPAALGSLARGARRSFEALYNEQANYRMLMNIYHEAIKVNQRKLI